jgi:uncharacterized protein
MSRSDPPPSPTVARIRQSSPAAPSAEPRAGRSLARRLNIRFAKVIRWVHIYLSMLSLALVLFFSVTGITLNHPDWFFANSERRIKEKGTIEPSWLKPKVAAGEAGPPGIAENGVSGSDDRADASKGIAKLEIVEHLRNTHKIRAALVEFRVEENECLVTFKGPGYAADAFIDSQSGRYELTQTFHGMVAVLNDLHKGRDTGPVWSAVIDVSAVFMTLISLSGLILLFYLKLRRVPGLAVGLIGAVAAIVICLSLVN